MIITKKRFNGLLEEIADLQVENAILEGQNNYLNNQMEIIKLERILLKLFVKEEIKEL